MSDYEEDKTWSEKMLARVVWPAIRAAYGGGNLLSVEGDHGVVTNQLDMTSGIDALIVSEKGIQSIASRVQRSKPTAPWNTFTSRSARNTRAKTEYEKRKSAIDGNDSLYPMLTLHAYVSNRDESFVSASIIKTEHLYRFIEEEPDKVKTQRAPNAIFKYVRWRDLAKWMIAKNIRGSMRVFKLQAEFNELVN